MRRIRTLNESLPEAAKIRFIGLDRTQDLTVARQHVQALLTEANYKPGKVAQLDTLQQLLAVDSTSEATLSNCARRLASTLEQSTSRTALGAQYADLGHVVRNLTYLSPRVRRDSVMLLNLQAEYQAKNLGQEKMYGLWGVYHVLQGPINNTLPLAGLLKKASLPFGGKVVSMAIFALESETLMPTAFLPASIRPAESYVALDWTNQQGPMVFVKGLKDLAKAAPTQNLTLFKLDAVGSPYQHSRQLLDIKAPLFGQNMAATKPSAVTTDYAQYAFLMRHSKALSPLPAQ